LADFESDPDEDGWIAWNVGEPGRYNRVVLGSTRVRLDGTNTCRMRLIPQRHHTNDLQIIHGGTILGLVDIAMFAALYKVRNIDGSRAVTISLDTQFIGAGDAAHPLDAVVEVLHETGRLCFLRGLVEQGENVIASFSGTIRKPSRP